MRAYAQRWRTGSVKFEEHMLIIMRKMTEYRVPRLMWEALESSLLIAGKRFVKRLAVALEVPEKELIREVFKKDDVKVCIHDWTDEEFMCPCWKTHGELYIHCENAKVCGQETCREHIGVVPRKPSNELSRVGYLISEDGDGDGDGDGDNCYKAPLERLVFYENLGRVVGDIADLKNIAKIQAKEGKISIDEFINSLN